MISKSTKQAVRLIFAVVWSLAAALIGPALAGEDVVIDGVPHVRNGAEPSNGRRTMKLEELWRAGGADDEDVFFGLLPDVLGDEGGNIYVLDAQLLQVHVFSPDGRLTGSLFREGEGPGEVLAPRDILMFPDGALGAVQEFPGKVIAVDRGGVPQHNLVVGSDRPTEGGGVGLIAGGCSGDNIVLSGVYTRPGERQGTQDRTYFLGRFSRSGKEEARYLSSEGLYDYTNFKFDERVHIPVFWWTYDVGPDGRVYAASNYDAYEISVFDAGGDLVRVIEREWAPRKRSADEREVMRRMIANALSNAGFDFTIEVEENDPAIAHIHRGIHVRPDGSLWVLPGEGHRDQPEGILATYDVFDPDGRFTEQVAVACEGDGDVDKLFFLGDRAVLVKGYLEAIAAMFGRGTPVTGDGEEAEPMEIVCFALPGS